MKSSLLKAGLIIMPLVGASVFLFWIFAGMGGGSQGVLSEYATGEMSAFRSETAPPAQPAMAFLTPDGDEVRLADYRGRIVLLNLWATWCAPCVEEMPALDQLEAELGGEDFAVVTVSLDRSLDDAAAFYERLDLQNLPLLHDATFASPNALQTNIPIGLPITVLYDRRGQELGRLSGGAEWASEDAFNLIRAAIRDH